MTNINDISKQFDYMFDFVDDLKLKGRYNLIDDSIDEIIKNSIDISIDLIVGLLTICGSNDDNIKNYNKLYYHAVQKCQSVYDKETTNVILTGLQKYNYNQWLISWIRTNKIKKIYEHKNL
ncbi:MAG: hypothetical protein WDA02_06700 [Saccharofermentanales bacterium]